MELVGWSVETLQRHERRFRRGDPSRLDATRDRLDLTQVARFANHPVALPSGLHWDVVHLYAEALAGLRAAAASEELASVAVDAWAVDYGLVRDGALQGVPFAYRDARGARGAERVHAQVPFASLYERTGLDRERSLHKRAVSFPLALSFR